MTKAEAIAELKRDIELENDFTEDYINAVNMAIEALEQEPFINKPCVSSGVCEHDKNKVLDEIRAEIEELKPNNPNFKGYFEQNVALNKVLEVIDKYKAESEE